MTRARLGALLVPCVLSGICSGAALAQSADERSAIVSLVPGVSFEELLSIPEVAALSRAGGAALMSNPQDVVVFDDPSGRGEAVHVLDPDGLGDLEGVGVALRSLVRSSPADDVLVIVLTTQPTREMAANKDELGGVAFASGSPADLFPETGEGGALTSDSTRRVGVVTGGDIRATVDTFVGSAPLAARELPAGEPIRVVDGPPPFELHERYLAQRRMYVPIGTAAAVYVTVAGIVAVAFALRRGSIRGQWRRIAGWVALSVPMLATGLLAAGHLPELTYASAIPMVAIVTVFGTMAFSPLERRDVTLVPAGIGAAVLGFFAVEALLGWTAMLTPLLGGSQLDGGRFYGMPNVAIGLLAGASLWVGQRLRTGAGVALTCVVASLAGLPFAGANLGGAITLFASAGLWLAVRERHRLGPWKGAGAFLAVTVAGSAAILLSHALSPVPTHVTSFERDVDGIAAVLERYLDRLQVGFDLIARSPAALVPLVGIPLVLVVVLRPPPAVRETFERWPAWRDAILVIALVGIVAYVANDSGPAATGLAFGLASGGMLGVSLLVAGGKMGTR